MVPSGWSSIRLGTVFKSRREKGMDGLPTLSVTLNDGLVERNSLDRKTDTNLESGEHLIVMPGDIAYNMMRMWQGASGLATKRALVSPAYVVLEPNSSIDVMYATYLFKTSRMVYLFWAYSYGLTNDRLRLYFRDFSVVPTILPPINEQRRIAEIIATWDSAIETTRNLLRNGQARKDALLQKLLSGEKRLPRFTKQWSTSSLCEVAEIIVSNVDKKSSANELPVRLCNYTDVYNRSQIESHQDFMAATATAAQTEKFALRVNDVLITKDSESPNDIAVPTIVKSTSADLLCGYHLAIIRPSNRIVGSFLKFYFELKNTRNYFASRANGATRFGLPVSAIKKAPLRFPSIQEQAAIASILESAELEIDTRASLLETLIKEKSALMQQLFTGNRRVKVRKEKAA